jgi:hypothetical protein
MSERLVHFLGRKALAKGQLVGREVLTARSVARPAALFDLAVTI